VVARKPIGGTVAANVLEWGTGGLNVDGCRVGTEEAQYFNTNSEPTEADGQVYGWAKYDKLHKRGGGHSAGRFPANVIHDGSDEVTRLFPVTKNGGQNETSVKGDGIFMNGSRVFGSTLYSGDTGSAARFFYCAKASKADRDENHHPTVKPTALMRYLCRLVTPPGGVVLDPFTGSGSTGKGAVIEGFDFIGIEREAEYIEIAERRIQAAKLPLFVESE
jgi:site-specific DNA-methyltransferase (adenine-specific)